MSIGEIPRHGEVNRSPIELGGKTYVFETNFAIALPAPTEPHEILIANQMRVFEAIAGQGLGYVMPVPGISNKGVLLEGTRPFYKRQDVDTDSINALHAEIASIRQDAFEGWDGEVPVPDTLTLLDSSEVEELVFQALHHIQTD